MNLQARIDRYRERGFQQLEAEILVLIEESAAALFTAFPDQFILFGGATLVLFCESPRLSRDLDLLASPTQIPRPEEIEDVVRSSIQSIAETLGLGQLEFRKDIESAGFVKQWVLANHRALFSIDLTSIGGNVLETQIVKKAIANDSEKIVATLSATYLLFQKCETFLNRRHVKARDAFDIHLLLTRGAHLDKNLQAHLENFIAMKEIDHEPSKLGFRTSMLSSARSNSAQPCHWPSSKSLPRTNLRPSAAGYVSCWLIDSGRNRNELDNYPDRRSTRQLHRAHRRFGSQTQAL
jgi:nucleotidyltransferase AbiEii toxin of type IV toxin-antitoxin system